MGFRSGWWLAARCSKSCTVLLASSSNSFFIFREAAKNIITLNSLRIPGRPSSVPFSLPLHRLLLLVSWCTFISGFHVQIQRLLFVFPVFLPFWRDGGLPLRVFLWSLACENNKSKLWQQTGKEKRLIRGQRKSPYQGETEEHASLMLIRQFH